MHPPALDDLLRVHLRAFLHDADDDALDVLRRELQWHELPAGRTLMREGDPGDAMYVLVSGRLRVSVADAEGRDRPVREIARGEVVGEMALITAAPRSATLVAMRDSVLARLAKPAFEAMVARHPALTMALTRQIIARLQTQGRAPRTDRPVAVTLLPLAGRAAEATALARDLAQDLSQHGRVALVDAATVTQRLGHAPGDDAESLRRIAVLLDETEAAHDTVLLLGDDTPTAWSRCCARHADEVLLVARADDSPRPGALERDCGLGPVGDGAAPAPSTVLLLLHAAGSRGPIGTARWLAGRSLRAHVHLREDHAEDRRRLARCVARRATGLVLSGGGARGAAHAGVYRALQRHGVPVDAVGGTSIGAVFGALMGFDARADDVVDTFARHFADNPTGDFTLAPMLSLVKGRRLRDMMERTARRFGGTASLDIADLWKPYFCIAANVSRAAEVVQDRGPLVSAVMASCAIPGAMPPVLRDGELLCDGGVFNNLPVDVMRGRWGIGHIIAVDLDIDRPRRIELTELPSPTQLLLDRLRPRRRRRYRLPSFVNYLLNVTALQGTARQRAATAQADLVIRPALPRIGMLQWGRFAQAVEAGEQAGTAALAGGVGASGAAPARAPVPAQAPAPAST